MATALVIVFAFVAALAVFDLAAAALGAESRDGFADDHRR